MYQPNFDQLKSAVKPVRVMEDRKRPRIGMLGATGIVLFILLCGYGIQKLIFG